MQDIRSWPLERFCVVTETLRRKTAAAEDADRGRWYQDVLLSPILTRIVRIGIPPEALRIDITNQSESVISSARLRLPYPATLWGATVEGDFLSSCGERVECENDSGEGLDVGKRGEFFEDCSYGRFVAGVGSSSRLPLPTNISKDRDRSLKS